MRLDTLIMVIAPLIIIPVIGWVYWIYDVYLSQRREARSA